MPLRPAGEDKAAVLEKCQRVSMEELRTNYDAVIAQFSVNKVSESRGMERCLPSLVSDAACCAWLATCASAKD